MEVTEMRPVLHGSPRTALVLQPDARGPLRAVLLVMDGVTVEATKSEVAVRADRRVADLRVPAMALKRGRSDLYLSLELTRRLRTRRMKESVRPSRGHRIHPVLIARKKDVDTEIRGWLRQAPETRGRTR